MSSIPTRRLLGFDIRRPPDEFTSLPWDSRDCYLLDPTIASPLSVDTMIWPSVFEYSMPNNRQIVIDPLQKIAAHGRHTPHNLWLDRNEMRTVYNQARPQGGRNGIEIVVELITLEPSARPFPLIDLHQAIGTVDLDSELGYDLADGSLISGLSNCKYSEDELKALRPAWARKLNRHGLLSTLEDTDGFRVITNNRVPEHAPFWIFALYRA